ncbi:MAG: sigma 54-interacting transcriptional regulator [Bacteroidetes bacterium]|nr:sigma 54-interacting transcriptional regulator [Bacteroidota bacterium]
MLSKTSQFSSKQVVKRIVIILSILFLVLYKSTGSSIDYTISSVFNKVWGEVQPDTNIILITITADDISQIGPWPIKRSYYALLINSLTKLKVKKIGLEVFLTAKFATQTLYDNLLVNEAEKSGNVVFSALAGSVNKLNDNFITDSLSFPSPKLLNDNLTIGHINYLSEKGIKIPLQIEQRNTKVKSFSAQLAGEDFYQNVSDPIELNITSSWKKFKQYSMLEFYRLVVAKSDELNNFENKRILIGITDPQIAGKLKSTFDEQMPGLAVHAFALDNLLNKRFIKNNWFLPSTIFFLLLLSIIFFAQNKYEYANTFKFYLITLVSFLVFSFCLFIYYYLKLYYALFLFPFVGMGLVDLFYYTAGEKLKLKIAIDEAELFKSLLKNKEVELSAIQNELQNSTIKESEKLNSKIKILKEEIEKLKGDENDKIESELEDIDKIKNFHGIIYKSKMINEIVDLIGKVAPEDANILILGESGTGKELVANAIHKLSKRSNNNFVTVNCGALTDSLIESELFGHVKGAFTGAVTDKKGRFEIADKGTIFLDEIGEVSENFQVKLLRVIQSGDYEKVGSAVTSHTDLRIVAATNKDLDKLVQEKKFREDLFYRLNVIKISIPPLRKRKEDILPIANEFLVKESEKIKLSGAVATALIGYDWKGNIRELQAVLKRAVIFAKAANRNLIQLSDLPPEMVKAVKISFDELVIESLREKHFSYSSVSDTAKELGDVSRTIVSENFRGYSFKCFVENNFNFDLTVETISGLNNKESIEAVENKLKLFLDNLKSDIENSGLSDFDEMKKKFKSKYKNLPQKFHVYLDEVIKYLMK